MKINKLLEELSVLNIAMFIVWNIGYWINRPVLIWISLFGICISLLCVLYALFKSKKSDEDYKGNYKHIINQMVFDIFFILAVVFTTLRQYSFCLPNMNRVDVGTIAPLIAPKRFGYVKLGIKRDREKAPLSLRMSVTSESLTQSAHNNML